MSVRVWPRRLFVAFVMGAVGVGLVSWGVASGTFVWTVNRAPHPGSTKPSTTVATTGPASTYPVVPVTAAQPGVAPARYLQPVYAVPVDAEAVPSRSPAIVQDIGEVTAWFRGQLGGAYPRYAPDGQAPRVVTVELPWSSRELATSKPLLNDLSTWLHDHGRIEPQAIPVIYVETTTAEDACAWTSVGTSDPLTPFLTDPRMNPELEARLRDSIDRFRWSDRIVIPVQRCPEERPWLSSRWPFGGTALLAHETTHALGAVDSKAPHHTNRGHVDDNVHDILYTGPEHGPADGYAIDPGHDDYYRHGRSDLVDIADSDLLVHPAA
jgi:hypothetical protein